MHVYPGIPMELGRCRVRLINIKMPSSARILAELDEVERAWQIFEVEYAHLLEMAAKYQTTTKALEIDRRAETAIQACKKNGEWFVERFIKEHLPLVAQAAYYHQMLFVGIIASDVEIMTRLSALLDTALFRLALDENIPKAVIEPMEEMLSIALDAIKYMEQLPRL